MNLYDYILDHSIMEIQEHIFKSLSKDIDCDVWINPSIDPLIYLIKCNPGYHYMKTCDGCKYKESSGMWDYSYICSRGYDKKCILEEKWLNELKIFVRDHLIFSEEVD